MAAIDNFRAAMRVAGLDHADPLHADGTLHRIRVEGDKGRNSWYVLHPGPPAAGAFGCWKRGIKEAWCERSGQLSQTEWEAVRQRWQEYKSLPPEQQQRVRESYQRFRQMPPERRSELRRQWHQMTPEQKRNFHHKPPEPHPKER